MDYEKAYNEALERASAGKPIDEVFPELKESEDERIREEIIGYLTHRAEVTGFTNEERDCRRWISYLERQKEHTTKTDACGFPIRDKGESACSYLERCLAPDMRNIWYEACAEIKERQKEHKLPEPEYGGENKQYPTEYCMDQDTRKKLIALVEKFGQEEDKDEMLDYLESYQPVQSASEVKEFNFQPGDPDEKAIKRLKAMIYFAFDETSEVPMDEACALDDWLDDKCKPAEWSDEDEKTFELLHTCVCRCINDDRFDYAEREQISRRLIPFIERLSSLRPQPHWKPSDEQMDYLQQAIEEAETEHLYALQRGLVDLMEELKKLF